ncbi:lytic transglycosylase domain-containing protein [Palleronia sediminis]|uniref:Lytic transglycosylase domain-containing protein n=1 Tax=Palleronia sediminis TaxID=2547833 RepID=A0A4R6A0U5_9RHOB|nr:transglycosylase SLT domain-containing protein [Palleronia sediminis]TDL74203.1 lytic transglycosylase domain-containing protein [Palleronia sediminis]
MMLRLSLAVIVALSAGAARADICHEAARRAASESGVPVDVLLAITLTETGRRHEGRFAPWPWTVNAAGEGRWFATRHEAEAFVAKRRAQGIDSIDIGCFQINLRWHGEAFATPDAMFDPVENARYAAAFLGRLHAETGDWTRAAGAFHSRTEIHAARYRRKFAQHREMVLADVGPPRLPRSATVARLIPVRPPRENGWPLMRAGASAGLGSLVPVSAAPRPLLETAR